MGTRSVTYFLEELEDQSMSGEGRIQVAAMYRQMDGYPTGQGLDLAEFLEGKVLTCGIPCGVDSSQMCNGMGCLAAQVVAHLKDGVGSIYLFGTDQSYDWIDYTYKIFPAGENDIIYMEVFSGVDLIFSGTPKEFIDRAAELDSL